MSISQEDVQLIFKHHSDKVSVDFEDYRSTATSNVDTASRTSTAFSRPFTSYSYVSSSTAGTTLTQKIDRMNKATIKLLAKQFIYCRLQIEACLTRAKLELASNLTIPEMLMYLQGTDLGSMPLSSLQNLILAVLLIQCPTSPDILLSFKSLISGCQNYVD